MSYRSDVNIALIKKDYLDLYTKIAALGIYNLLDKEKMSDYEEFSYDEKEWVMIEYTYIKWYSDYPEIKVIEEFLNTHPHQLVRLGEDIDDIEYENTTEYHDFFMIHRYAELSV